MNLIQDFVEIYNNEHMNIIINPPGRKRFISSFRLTNLAGLSSCWLDDGSRSSRAATGPPRTRRGRGRGTGHTGTWSSSCLDTTGFNSALASRANELTADRQTWLGFGLVGHGAKLSHSITLQQDKRYWRYYFKQNVPLY